MPATSGHTTFRPDEGDSSALLRFPERRFSPIRNIGVRLGIAFLALVFTTVIVWAEQDCYQDRGELTGLSWIDAFYYATVTLSTTGYGDKVTVA